MNIFEDELGKLGWRKYYTWTDIKKLIEAAFTWWKSIMK